MSIIVCLFLGKKGKQKKEQVSGEIVQRLSTDPKPSI